MNCREAAYLSSLTWKKHPTHHKLQKWIEDYSPKEKDIALAKEIAFGTIKRWISLRYITKDLLPKHYTFKDQILFFQAAYQHYFMDKVPLYAIVDASVEIAKKHLGKAKGKMFNAVLRQMPQKLKELEEVKDDLSLYYSYPAFFINQLPRHNCVKVLEVMNRFYPPCFRLRKGPILGKVCYQNHLTSVHIEDKKLWPELIKDPNIYIQNVTYTYFIDTFSELIKTPATILDLCASPGGKSLALYDLFPNADITANDITPEKMALLKENKRKYQMALNLTMHPAESYPLDKKYDLILLDLPCSGSGVLGKRPEARHRLTASEIKKHSALQKKILKRASSLLNAGGSIWYMTCSILQQENEKIIEWALSLGLQEIKSLKIFPNEEGWDGGFAALLQQELL